MYILQKRAKGQVLLDLVFQHLELIEKDYFGLQYAENGVSTTIPTSDVMVTYLKKLYTINYFIIYNIYFFFNINLYI